MSEVTFMICIAVTVLGAFACFWPNSEATDDEVREEGERWWI